MDFTLQPIGIIHSPFLRKEDCPKQGVYSKDADARIEVFSEYEEALKDIETFSHIFLLYYFDKAGEIILSLPTFLDDEPHGVFASRHPCRPNGLGLSVVKLLSRDGCMMQVSDIDVLDKTPLIDIKPYVPRFDCHPEATEGWIDGKQERQKPPGCE
ncbi:tRNA (N6-threonylcarbamoyladenosine(37)-N6)-methyltransferase TrmO [candidate division KSB1 bacterium]